MCFSSLESIESIVVGIDTIELVSILLPSLVLTDISRIHIHQNLKFDFFEVASTFWLYSEIPFFDIRNLFAELITYTETGKLINFGFNIA